MHAVADFLTRRSDRMPTEQEAAETSPSTPRKKKNLNNASPMSASPDKLNTPSKASLEEVKQSTATNFYATLKYYDPASTAEQRAQEVCRMINNNATLKPAMVARALPISKSGKHTGGATVTIDTDIADSFAMEVLERVVLLADTSLKHVADFIAIPEECDMPLLLSTIATYMTAYEKQMRQKDKETEWEYEFRVIPNGDIFHRDMPYLRDMSSDKGFAVSMVGVATSAGTLRDIVKGASATIAQEGDFLYIDDDDKVCMSEELLTKVSKGMDKTLKSRKVQPGGKVNGGTPPQVDGMLTWKSESAEVLKEPVTLFVESEFGREDFKSTTVGAVGVSVIRHIFGVGVAECWANNRDISHGRVLRINLRVMAPYVEEARMKLMA